MVSFYQSMKFHEFTIVFKLLSRNCIFVHLESDHIASTWFKTVDTSSNHCLEMKKLKFTCGSNILPLSVIAEFLKHNNHDTEGTRLTSEISQSRTDLIAYLVWQSIWSVFQR